MSCVIEINGIKCTIKNEYARGALSVTNFATAVSSLMKINEWLSFCTDWEQILIKVKIACKPRYSKCPKQIHAGILCVAGSSKTWRMPKFPNQ